MFDECDDEEEMHAKICERLIELDRDVIVDALGFGRQGHEDIFIALALTSRFPSGDFEDYADMIEREYPVDMDDLRHRDGFASFKEYKKYIESDEAAEFVYGDLCNMSTPSLSKAFSWVGGGCPKEL